MNVITPILLMVLPSLLVRSCVLHPNLTFSPRRRVLMSCLYFLAGVILDLFALGQSLLIYWLSLQALPALATPLFLIALAFLQGMIIFDGFLLHKTGIRLEIGYLRFAKNIRSFWDSGKEKGFALFLPLQLLVVSVQSFAWGAVSDFNPGGGSFWLLSLLALLSLIILKKASPKLRYYMAPLLLLYEGWLIEKWRARFDTEGADVYKNKEVFEPENETKEYLSQQFPLLKLTQGFSGDKNFELTLNERPNIVMIFLESFRAKEVGCLGNTKNLTPHFDRLAARGILFNQFYSNSVKTSRCVLASLFGIPSDVDGSGISNRVNTPYISLAEILQGEGYHSAYLHNGALKIENQREFFQNHGFQTVMGKDEILKGCPHSESTSWGVHDEYMLDYGLHWIKERQEGEEPYFLTIFTISNHHPWKLPQELDDGQPLSAKTSYDRYQKTFSYTDKAVGEFVDAVNALPQKRPTLFVILGDHGFPMGEHEGNCNQHKGLYEEQIRVPLLIYGEGVTSHPAVVTTPCSQLDLMPTFLDLLDIEAVNHCIGSSLLRKRSEPKAFFHNPYMYRFFGMRKGKYKCVYMKNLGEAHLFDLEADPQEERNIAHEHPEIVAEMVKNICDYEKGMHYCYERKRITPLTEKQKKLIFPTLEIDA